MQHILTHDRSLYLAMWGAFAVATEALGEFLQPILDTERNRSP